MAETISLTQAFRNYIGSIAGAVDNISYTFVGRDPSGGGVYRFSYRTRSGTIQTVLLNVVRSGDNISIDGYTFSPPSGQSPPEDDLPTLDEVDPVFDAAMAEAKERARALVTDMLGRGQFKTGTAEFNNWIAWINAFQGQPQHLLDEIFRLETLTPPYAGQTTGDGEAAFDPYAPVGGGGFAGPVYRAPDRRVVEDFVKGGLISLVGFLPDQLKIDQLVDVYLRDHRRNFDSPEQEIDPSQSILQAIRQSNEYKTIHQLRPDTVDERSWISDRRAAAAQGGLNLGEQEDFAIVQATAGGDVADVREAAAFTQLSRSGQAPDFLNGLVRSVANNMFLGVRR